MPAVPQVCSTFSVNDQPHYQFTPRDLTQWVQGLKRYDLDSLRLPEAVAHEACRVFRDRLVEGAAENFSSLLVSVLNSMIQFRGDISTWVCSTLGASAEDRMSGDNSRLRMVKWGLEDFAELVAEKLKSFEREFKELNMMLFPEVLERLARFDRVLSTPGGSLMLCGSSGVGRRSCMLLMAYMHHMEFFTPKMTKWVLVQGCACGHVPAKACSHQHPASRSSCNKPVDGMHSGCLAAHLHLPCFPALQELRHQDIPQ